MPSQSPKTNTQIQTSAAYEKHAWTDPGFHSDRAVSRHCHPRHPGRLLVACLGPRKTPGTARQLQNNLKQVGLSFRTWAIDHDGRMPMSVSQAQGGDSEDVGVRVVGASQAASRGVSKMFLVMSNQLSTPKILFCPAEFDSTTRQAATTFSGQSGANQVPYLNDYNVSYFIGVDASESLPADVPDRRPQPGRQC